MGYNTPLALWTLYALASAAGLGAAWPCPIRAWLGVCPGCGLTTAYADLLRGQVPHHGWFYVVFIALLANSAWSIRRAVSLSRHALPRD